MKHIALGFLLLLPIAAEAQTAPPSQPGPPVTIQKPEDMVLIPRRVVGNLYQGITIITALRPELKTPVIEGMMQEAVACLTDNPGEGVVKQPPDLCPASTQAVKEAAELRGQVTELQRKLAAEAMSKPGVPAAKP